MPADVLAREFFSNCVESGVLADAAEFSVPPRFVGAFRSRARLFREAAGLLVLLSRAQEHREYGAVVCAYEMLVFGESQTREAQAKLRNIKSAMSDFTELIAKDAKPLQWAIRWFHTIGVKEYNPAELALFEYMWLTLLEAMQKGIDGLRPTWRSSWRYQINYELGIGSGPWFHKRRSP